MNRLKTTFLLTCLTLLLVAMGGAIGGRGGGVSVSDQVNPLKAQLND